jgi:uncharacterized cupin superfamily protein
MNRPAYVKHYSEIEDADNWTYPQSDERLCIRAPFGKKLGLTRIGINHDTLPPGRRSSYPHAEGSEEEAVYIVEGTPDLWINGTLHRLRPGDCAVFPAGTGNVHTFINNTATNVRMLVVGETISGAKVHYPLNPERKTQVGDAWWEECPHQPLGDHSGLPDNPVS